MIQYIVAKIEKKVWPEYFEAIITGKKTFELRLADWKCKAGDILILKEWNPKTQKYSGRKLEKKITYVRKFKVDKLFWPKEDVLKHGLQIIAFK